MDKTVVIRCFDTCYYTLVYPAFFLDRPKATIQKLFRWLFAYEWYSENEATIAFLDRELPLLPEIVEAQGKERIARREQVLQERKATYEKEYLDPNMARMPRDWSESTKTIERDYRKQTNTSNKWLVKEAEAELDHTKKQAVKDVARAKEIYEIYKSEKR